MKVIRVAEMFAGVGGFRHGLEKASSIFKVTFSNQWEPGRKVQFASECYERHFPQRDGRARKHFNEDIEKVLDRVEAGKEKIGPFELVVAGFPCQDYSVAKPKNQSEGLRGKKGVLWWQIFRLLQLQERRQKLPKWLFFENVDRLIKSPANQRGRDFAVILHCLNSLGYEVEWRVINAADYGYPQKRRRVLILATKRSRRSPDADVILSSTGVLARAFPADYEVGAQKAKLLKELPESLAELSSEFGKGAETSAFQNAGFASNRRVWTVRMRPQRTSGGETLGDHLEPLSRVPEEYFVPSAQLPKWKSAKDGKKQDRINKASGVAYQYKEGSLRMPDPLDEPARTILTSEGGSSPSRSKHIVQQPPGQRYRRLMPVELERLNGFEDGWTEGMRDSQRAFCMGNALVVGLVTAVGTVLAGD